MSSERYVLDALAKGTFSPARSLHGGLHELAHFWWMIADPNSAEDWINEGLAEFSAFRASSKRFGPARRTQLLSAYLQDASQCATRTPITSTGYQSEDRYVNRYEKVSLLLAVLEQRHGSKAMDGLLRKVFQAFRGTRLATTPAVLALAEQQLGGAARTFLEAGLNQQDFPLEAIRKDLQLPAPAAVPKA